MNRKYFLCTLLTTIVISSIFIGIRNPNQITLESSEIQIEDKIDPLILEKLSDPKSSREKIDVIILISEDLNLAEIDFLRKLDIIQKFDSINGFAAQISLDLVYQIAEMEEVKGIWLDRPELGKPTLDTQWQLQEMMKNSHSNGEFVNYSDEIGATELWNKGINGSGSVIAILDSGIDLTGQIGGDLDDFDENMNTYDAKFVGAVSLVPEEPLYYTDFNGRGTYHAGIACGTGYNNNSYKGVAPGANYLNVKVYDSVGLTYWSFLISGIEWSIQHSCDIILFCADIPGIYFDPISLAITKAVEQGVVVIVPTGDDGPSYMSVTTPGQSLGAISVGAYDTELNLVANFSGRGPGLDFRVGPDLVAPGTNLIGPRSKILTNESLALLNDLTSLLNFAGIGIEIDSDIVFNLPNGVFPTPQYGTPINENYTKSSGTGAAAAVVAGCVALLIEAFPLANPQLIRTALCDSCTPILGDFNTEGCGLVNVSAAYNYLYNYFGNNQFTKIPYSAPLIYTGFVSTSDTANWTATLNSTELVDVNSYDLNALVSTQLLFDALVVSNGTDQIDFTQIHLPINQFGFDYGGRVHWLSEFTVLREFHQISSINIGEDDYNRFLGVLELNGLIATVIVETWNYITTEGPIPQYSDRLNGYKISLKLLNLRENEDISDLRLVSYFRSDLFVNETGLVTYDNTEGISSILDIGKDDTITYDSSLQTMVVSDQTNNSEYLNPLDHASMGFNSTTHQLDSYKISESISLFSELTLNGTENGFLDNSTDYSIGIDDPGFVMKWNLTDEYSYGQTLEFSSILSLGLGTSFGNSESSLFEQMHYLNSEVSFYPIEDIIVAKADFIRMAPKDEIYSSKALILNVGNVKINSSTVVFGANRTTSEGYIEVYSKISTITNFEVQDYYYITQHWTPLEEGIYLTGWAAVIPVIYGSGREDNILNNYLIRNVYIYSKLFYQSILKEAFRAYPTKLDVNPMKVHYPGDLGLFNISTFGVLNIPEVTVSISSPGEKFMKIMWFGP
ncbi:MAG: S8 family serine peptidase, partial [Promethearchaeota archaeon]